MPRSFVEVFAGAIVIRRWRMTVLPLLLLVGGVSSVVAQQQPAASPPDAREVNGDAANAGAGAGVDQFPLNERFPVVPDVFCRCLSDQEPRVLVRWTEPEDFEFEFVQIFTVVSGDPGRRLLPIHEPISPGVQFAELLELMPDEFLIIGVSFFRDGEYSVPTFCSLQCPEEVTPPLDVKISPDTSQVIMQPPGRPVTFVVDGTESLDFEGGRNLEYFWELDRSVDGIARIFDARSAVARVFVQALPENVPNLIVRVRLRAIARAGFNRPAAEGESEFEILVVRADPDNGQFREIVPVEVHPIFRRTLANPPRGVRAERLHVLDFQINLSGGVPFPRFVLREGPEGLNIEPDTGRVRWAPRFDQAGREHPVVVSIVSSEDPNGQRVPYAFEIEVFAPTTPTALYQLGGSLPEGDPPAGGGGAGRVDVQEVLGPAPSFVPDRTNVTIPFDLNLNIPTEVTDCSVQLVTRILDPGNPDGEFLQPTVRFDPEICRRDADGGAGGDADQGRGGGAGAGSSGGTGGYYTSGSAGACLAQEMIESDEFAVELWVANVSDVQSGAAFGIPAHIFSLSKTATDFNWRIGVEDAPGANQRFVAEVNTSAGVVRLSHEADFSGGADHQIVLTRRFEAEGQPAKHRLFVDGVSVAEADAPGDLSVFSTTHAVYVGAGAAGANPYTGDVSTCGTYAEPLSDGMVSYLFGIGPSDPTPGEVDDPLALICPDPQEIGRTDWRVDGTESEAGIGAGAGGGGAGGSVCEGLLEFLYPFEWSVSPDAGVSWSPARGYEDCRGVVDIAFPAPESPVGAGTKRYDVTLVVKQVPVRGGGIRTSSPVTSQVVIHDAFRRGDSNGDGAIDVSDAATTLLWLFSSPPPTITCRKSADFDNNEIIDMTDAILELEYIFQGGSPPPAPGVVGCGFDDGIATPGVALTCLRYDHCP